jgi:hypothetical protein
MTEAAEDVDQSEEYRFKKRLKLYSSGLEGHANGVPSD